MFLKLDGDGPLNRQLYRALRDAIENATLKPGDRLMPTRMLRERLNLSRNVVLMAYAQLQAEGYLDARQGAGTFIAKIASDRLLPARTGRKRSRLPDNAVGPLSALGKRLVAMPFALPQVPGNYYDFRYGKTHVPGETQADWLRMERHTVRDAFKMHDMAGLPALRQAIAAHLRQHRGLTAASDDILITAGAQEALDLILRLCVEPGTTIVVENSHYASFSALARAYGAAPHFVPTDSVGMDTRRLPAIDSTLVYVTPSHQFPTGTVLSLERRRALLDWANRTKAFIVEDDYDSEFRYDAQPLPPLKTLDSNDRVIYVGSFSKLLSPALRIGYVIAPSTLSDKLRRLKSLTTVGMPTRAQSTLAAFIGEGLFARHLRRVRRIYAERRAALLKSLERRLGNRVEIYGAEAGLHVLMNLRDIPSRRAASFVKDAYERRAAIFAATHFFAEPPPSLPLLLAFGGIEATRIDAGVKALAQAMDAAN